MKNSLSSVTRKKPKYSGEQAMLYYTVLMYQTIFIIGFIYLLIFIY